MEIFNDDLDLLEIVNNGFPRRVNERKNHFDEMDNLLFFKRFRVTRPTVLVILQEIEDSLEFQDDRNQSVSPMNQLLTCLRFYATGGHLSSIADFMGVDTSTVSRIIKRGTEALANLRPVYISMPHGERDTVSIQNKFFQMYSFPRVLGCIDGTHIRIQSPGGIDAEVFRNRKGYFSIKTQVISDADLKIRDIVARWPGSAHDQNIFVNSRIRARLEDQEYPNSVLLGDSGYGLRNYLLTPLANPVQEGEQRYNESHIRTRNSIERVFGIWKRRFPVLAYGSRLKLETSLSVIVATAVLHNIARDMNEEEPPAEGYIDQINYLIEMGNIPDIAPDKFNNHQMCRNNIINYFINMPRH